LLHSREMGTDKRVLMTNRLFMSRATFLKAAASAAAFPFLNVIPKAYALSMAVLEVAPGVFVHRGQHAAVSPENAGDISNITFVVGADAVAVIDTGGSFRIGREARAALKAITPKPVRYVINTHMHPDHVFGNAAFEDDKPEYVGHHKLARGLTARAEHYIKVNRGLMGDAAFEGTKIIVPTREVKDTLELDLGQRVLSLKARPTAHTDNDLTVLDTATGTIILGDLLFSGHVPTLDGSIAGWLKLIETLRTENAARVVPGHGPAAMPWPDAMAPLERYLKTVAQEVRSMIKSGKTIAEASKTAGLSEKEHWLQFDEFHVRNVTAAFAELEWE
jgi:quinoprotein relay system zinc metallohydrolase 2